MNARSSAPPRPDILRASLRQSLGRVVGIAVLTIATGLVPTLFFVSLVELASGKVDAAGGLVRVAAFCVAAAVLPFFVEWSTVALSTRIVRQERQRLARIITGAPVDKLEAIGDERLRSVLAHDALELGDYFPAVAHLLANALTVTSALAYIGYLSLSMLLIVAVAVIASVILMRGMAARFASLDARYRASRDAVNRDLGSLVLGAKELRLNAVRHEAFVYGRLHGHLGAFADDFTTIAARWAAATAVAKMMVYAVLIFLAAAGATSLHLSAETTLSVLLATFYIQTMVHELRTHFRKIASARSAAVRLQQVERLLEGSVETPWVRALDQDVAWKSIEAEDLVYTRPGTSSQVGDRTFGLGPINLSILRGTIVFLVGGNGSGKSTLLKLLAGLYRPTSGELHLGSVRIDDSNRSWYRQHFSSVFFDFHLFDDVAVGADPTSDERARALLATLKLENTVTVEDNRFSTTALSSGQRKRLALVVSYLEDRQIFLFDEWAADQDPSFKQIFYRKLLPELRARGKTIIVVSHDDRFFDVANQIVKLDEGRLAEDATGVFMARLRGQE